MANPAPGGAPARAPDDADPPLLQSSDPSPPLAEPVIGPAQEALPEDGKKKKRPWRKYEFDDETIEEMRRRYEETDDTALAISRWCGVSDTHFNRMAKDKGWVKFRPGPMGLSPAAKLNTRASALFQTKADDGPPPLTHTEFSATARTLLRSAEAHAAELEAVRKQASAAGLRPRDAHLITANIADMTATLSKLRQLCAPEPQRTSADDDRPQDIDEVREALAQRIEALVSEWLAEEADEGSAGDRGDADE